MPFTYRRRKAIIPGLLYLNIGRRGVSLSFRAGPVGHTVSTTGRRTTAMNLLGGLGYRTTSTSGGRSRAKEAKLADLQTRKDAALARREARRNGQR